MVCDACASQQLGQVGEATDFRPYRHRMRQRSFEIVDCLLTLSSVSSGLLHLAR